MSTSGGYEPSTIDWVADQVARFEASGGTEAATLPGTDAPIVVLTTVGARTGAVRKSPVMRVEHEGRYVAVASVGGAPRHPAWYANVVAHPDVVLQDGARRRAYRARVLAGDERDLWWERAVAAWPRYEAYRTRTTRVIPVVLLEPVEAPAP